MGDLYVHKVISQHIKRYNYAQGKMLLLPFSSLPPQTLRSYKLMGTIVGI
jgi:hypothetical protein